MQTSVATYNTTNPAVFYGGNFCYERKLSWDEENRLRSICDNGYVSSYFYDAAGERTVKLHGGAEGIHVNSAFSGGYINNVDYTLYVGAYMVLEKGGQYTKHIYNTIDGVQGGLVGYDTYQSSPKTRTFIK